MYKLKKIASLFASALTIGSTFGVAMAANYPSPFVSGGSADVAVVYGAAGANTDLVAATDINADLTGRLITTSTGGSGGTTTTVDGEAFPLFTSSSELFLNSTLNSVRSILTDSELPTLLEDGTLETYSSIDYQQKVNIGPQVITFAQMPSSDDDPQIGISIGTSPSSSPVYNLTIDFDENVNFTHSDSVGETLDLFGQRFTVGAATTNTKLVLLRSSQTVDLSSDNSPSATVTVDGEEYTVELVAASDTSATIKITDSAGNSDSKEVSESSSKKIRGLEVAVDRADENNFRLTATVSVGSNKLVLEDNNAVKVGADETTLDGTYVRFYLTNGTSTTSTHTIGKLVFQSAAEDTDEDAITMETPFVDPIFGTLKVDFTGVSEPLDSDSREMIEVTTSGNDRMDLKLQSHDASEPKSITWVYNRSDSYGGGMDLADNGGDPFVVREMGAVNRSQYVAIYDDDGGYLFELTSIQNSSSDYTGDYVELKNVFTGETKQYKATSEGTIQTSIEGKTYTITYNGASGNQAAMTARFNSDDTSGQGIYLFPTIKTKNEAKVAFYEPTTIDLANWAGTATDASALHFPDGNGFGSAITLAGVGDASGGTSFNVTCDSTTSQLNLTATFNSKVCTAGKISYNITISAANTTTIYLRNPTTGASITQPALVIFEEEDDNNNYEALIVTLDGGYDGDSAGIGVQSVIRTWAADAVLGGSSGIRLESNDDLYQKMDWWGTLITLDQSDSDQTTAMISYPDDQVEAMVYVAEVEAAFSQDGPSGSSSGVPVVISDAEAAASTRNLIVVGGSCVNTMAAQLLGSTTPLCGDGFTTSTGVSSGSFLIETFARSGGKVATLVAGYNAGDTTNAATALRTQTVDTTVGKKYTGSTSTSITAAAMEDTA